MGDIRVSNNNKKKERFSVFLQGEAAFLILPTAEIDCQNGMFAAGALGKIQQILLKQTNKQTMGLGFFLVCVETYLRAGGGLGEALLLLLHVPSSFSCCGCPEGFDRSWEPVSRL